MVLDHGMYHVLSLSAFPHTIILNSFSAHTDEHGVWVHTLDNADVTWFACRGCSTSVDFGGSWGGDYMKLGIWANHKKLNGAWCDSSGGVAASDTEVFICESVM